MAEFRFGATAASDVQLRLGRSLKLPLVGDDGDVPLSRLGEEIGRALREVQQPRVLQHWSM